MLSIASTLPLAAVFELSSTTIGFLTTLAAITAGATITVSSLYFQHQRKRLWHETARIALEKGQPVPSTSPEKKTDRPRQDLNQHDLRAGLILMAAGAGIFAFFNELTGTRLAFLGAIPGFIGVALVLHHLITKISGPKTPDSKLPPA